ncbi:MAG TPA: hypothetical protein H9985_03925 [Candidatus Anaerofilum faecale]|nr:hypothetical protein [Candidatus Anaerofilum faecale]
MSVLDRVQRAFPDAKDCTSPAMKNAIRDWFRLYFDDAATEEEDPCQRLPVAIVGRLGRACFGEYAAGAQKDFAQAVLDGLEAVRRKAMQLALIGGESWLKPLPGPDGFSFAVMRRDAVAVLGRDAQGEASDLVSVEVTRQSGRWYTLLERRTQTAEGVRIENRLFSSHNADDLGSPVGLGTLEKYAGLKPQLMLPGVSGLGLVPLRMSLENCVDGSSEPVSVYAAAAGLIHSINRNERQLAREFDNGQSRVFASADLLRRRPGGRAELPSGLFVGLDDDPETTGLTVFSPALRQQSFLERKREYLRNLESLIGLKRGLLGEVEAAQRTATEVTSSQGDYALTIQDLQQMWETALRRTLVLCGQLGTLYRLPGAQALDGETDAAVEWGNGVLYDKDKAWAETMQLVSAGMLRPEIALAWKYDLPWESEADLEQIRQKYMPAADALLE